MFSESFLSRQLNKRPLTIIGAIIIFGMSVFFGTMVVGINIMADPEADCKDALDDAAVISATVANNGNILCKIIDADSVERSVWLDGDGVVLK